MSERKIDKWRQTSNDSSLEITNVVRRRMTWKLAENTQEQNLHLGIKNVLTLFLERFPEFTSNFQFDKNGEVIEEKKEDAKKFILSVFESWESFQEVFGGSIFNRKRVPYFEGSYKIALQKSFEVWGINLEMKNRTEWKDIYEKDQKKFQELIELEATRVVAESGINLTQKNLTELGLSKIAQAVRYYPGGLPSLRKKIQGDKISRQVEKRKREVHINNEGLPEDNVGRIMWSYIENNEERINLIEQKAAKFIDSTSLELNLNLLRETGNSELSYAINSFYPGGIRALREKFGFTKQSKTPGYWQDLENLRAEGMNIYKQHGRLTYELLRKIKRMDFYSALVNYPGRLTGLRKDLGIEVASDGLSSEEADRELRNLIDNMGG